MIGKLFLLALLASVQARPNFEDIQYHYTWSPNELCPEEGVHWLLPHETDCDKFYYCEYGLRRDDARDCAPGTVFSYEEQVCVWPTETHCGVPGYPGTPTNPGTDAPEAPETDAPATDAPATEAPATEAPEDQDGGDDSDNNSEGSDDKDLLPNGCPVDYTEEKLYPGEQCGVYLQCVNGELVERSCPAGLYFNYEIQECDWPQNTNCDGSADSGDDNGDSDNNGGDSENETEDNDDKDDESDDNDDETEDNDGESEDNDNGNDDKDDGSDDNTEVDLLPNGCPADYTNEKLYPGEQCGLYLQCVNGELVERSCPAGLYFNNEIQECDWPQNTNCEGSADGGDDNGDSDNNDGDSENETEDNDDKDDESDDNDNEPEDNDGESEDNDSGNDDKDDGSDDNAEVDLLPNGCPADYTNEKLYPGEQCGVYLQCVNGELVERSCPAGLYFNYGIQECDWPQNTDCEGSDNGGDNEDSENEDGDSENGTDDNDDKDDESDDNDNGTDGESEDNGDGNDDKDDGSDDNNEVDLLPNGCPSDYTNEKLYPGSQCGVYLQCVNGELVERSCPAGLYFNNEIQECDWPQNTNCDGSDDNDESDNDGGNSENESEDNDDKDDGSDDKEDESDDNDEESDDKDVETDDKEDESDDKDEVDLLPNGCPADFTSEKLYPGEQCGVYLQCVNGELIERSCPTGLAFNYETQECDWPENTNCAGSDNGDGVDESDNEDEDDESDDKGEETDDNDDGESDSENNNEDKDDQEDSSNGGNDRCKNSCNTRSWAHETDCDKFWSCEGETAVLGTCSEGLHFNANTKTCDFICNAGCVRDDAEVSSSNDGLRVYFPWDKVDDTVLRLLKEAQHH